MKHYLSIFLITLLFVSCGPPEFEKNTRILVKGSLVDGNSNSIPNVEISIYTRRPLGFIGRDGNAFLLGRNYSQQNGIFNVTSLFDRDDDFTIEIDGQDKFSNYVYSTNTTNYLPQNLIFELQTVTLKTLSDFNYKISRESPQGTQLRFFFKYKSESCYEFFDEGVLNPIKTNCFTEISTGRFLNDDNPDISNKFLTLLGSEIEFRYTINDEPEVIETCIIDKENYEFEFSY